MDRITITAKLVTQVATPGFFTLDGLLAGIIFDEVKNVEEAHATVPIRRTGELFHASAMFTNGAAKEQKAIMASMHAQHRLDPDLIARSRSGNRLPKMRLLRADEFGNVEGRYTIHKTDTISWETEGDADAIMRLLTSVHFIGAHRARGQGEIDSWSVEHGDLDGLTGYAGEPLRPIPTEMFKGDKSAPIICAAWKPAYWAAENRAACYAPVEVVQ